jgi:multidrug efflux pump subunit AcrB
MSGIDHLLYFGSESDSDGAMTITLYFAQGTNPDTARCRYRTNCSWRRRSCHW